MPKNKILYKEKFKDKQKTIGVRHKQLREEFSLRIQDITEKYGIGPATVSDSENGKQEFPLSYITTFCADFGINLAWLVNGDSYIKYVKDVTQAILENKVSEAIEKYGVKMDPYLDEIIEYLKSHPDVKETVWHLVRYKKGSP